MTLSVFSTVTSCVTAFLVFVVVIFPRNESRPHFPLCLILLRAMSSRPSDSFVKSLSAHVPHAKHPGSTPVLFHCCFLEPLPPAPVCAAFTRPGTQPSLWECPYLSPLLPKSTASSFLVCSFVLVGHIL